MSIHYTADSNCLRFRMSLPHTRTSCSVSGWRTRVADKVNLIAVALHEAFRDPARCRKPVAFAQVGLQPGQDH
jgi:hypothetical protein